MAKQRMASLKLATARFSGVQSAARNSAQLIGTHFSSILIRIIYIMILVRSLSPADYGILNYGLSWYLAFIPLTYLGADVVLSRGIARRREAASELLGITLGLRCYAIVLVVVASIVLAGAVENDGQVRSLLLLFSVALIGRSLWMWGMSAFTAFEEARVIMQLEIMFRVLEVGALIVFLTTAQVSLVGIAIIHVGSWCLQGAVTIAEVRRRHKVHLRQPDGRWIVVLRDGIPGAIFAIAAAAFFQLPVILFRQVEGTSMSLGYFALALQLVASLQIIPYAIATASLPVLSRSAARGDGKDRAAVLLLVAVIVLAGAVLATGASFFVSPLVEGLFGARYASAAILLSDALWLLIPISISMLLQQILFSNSIRSKLGAAAPLLGVTAMVILFPRLTLAAGHSGAFLAMAIGISIWLLCTASVLIRAGFFSKHRGRDVLSDLQT
jgi:O-antigen/teichoic acid export membrane protein